MNNLDMYSREKANRIHLDELRREAQDRHMLSGAKRHMAVQNSATLRMRAIVLAVSIIIAAIAFFIRN